MARSDEIPQHGRKRHADGDPDGAQPLAKRFGYLHIGNPFDTEPRDGPNGFKSNTLSHVSTTASATSLPVTSPATSAHDSATFAWTVPTSTTGTGSGPSAPSDAMMLDDTPHTTYIHDLDRELADIDVTEGPFVILPLAAKMLAVPESVLAGPSQGKELVLYSDPSSLSVPREHDSVRKAILESRARARKRSLTGQTTSDRLLSPPQDVAPLPASTPTPDDTRPLNYGDDLDAMEIEDIS
ncbi:hypothetical protein PDE_00996 [Penicillium oxalicum 114-2]|uniref:Uncharacterized protein n=1 Tax=Penicillium oxalicum (strain 114-2 / CGMCC 5302) TaxID=933388 RepID=S7Z689_PENO1|nr:hypothetical protein PDE_00996 [Penicillium oxalicum 114-2]